MSLSLIKLYASLIHISCSPTLVPLKFKAAFACSSFLNSTKASKGEQKKKGKIINKLKGFILFVLLIILIHFWT
ncbi:hypothetical protein PFNF54_01359 [Plasmodium falciparum NF54]|uniref:Uncharacterized protein n=1 Tax=Plasmodium falciparum (isolate NF54) TaxID=5843 RepID=W7K9W0_PLAFO|nr:hypothetical protein PFNF54_01359 [Plasmodium falciparum NF54]